MEVKFRLTRPRVALLVIATALVSAGLAAAVTSNAYTDEAGVYHGCVNSSSGQMRVLLPGDACRNAEIAIDWNQTGPQGPQGVQGEKGDRGEKGDTGDQGIQGIQGEKGDKGDAGEQGIQGIQGDKGDKGDPGEKGDAGEQGIQGIQGEKGDKGDPGEQGIQGIQGIQGEQGEKGDKGDPGEAGADGADGGLSGYEIVHVFETIEPPPPGFTGGSELVTASCPAGKKVLGGTATSGGSELPRPVGVVETGWRGSFNRASLAFTAHVYAICANVN